MVITNITDVLVVVAVLSIIADWCGVRFTLTRRFRKIQVTIFFLTSISLTISAFNDRGSLRFFEAALFMICGILGILRMKFLYKKV